MTSSSSPIYVNLGPNGTYTEVHGDQKNYTFVFNQVQVIRQRLSSIDALPPGCREELTDISNCLADVVVSVLHRHQQLHSNQLKWEIQTQVETAVALNKRLIIREESKASDSGDTETITSVTQTVYTLGSYAHFFEDPSADPDLASSLENLINGPLAPSLYPYPMGPARESTYSFHFHPPLPPSKVTASSVSVDIIDTQRPGKFQEERFLEHSNVSLEAYAGRFVFQGSLSFEAAMLKAKELHACQKTLKLQGRTDEALDAIQTTVSLYRELAKHEPEDFNFDLSRSLFQLYKRLSDLDRHEMALEAIQEAVAILRALAHDDAKIYNSHLAISLFSFDTCLTRMGRLEEGLTKIEEAVLLYRQLAEANPKKFNPGLADALENFSVSLLALNRKEEALESSRELVAIYRELADGDQPGKYKPYLSKSLRRLAQRLYSTKRYNEALKIIKESVALYRDHAKDEPALYKAELADSLLILSRCFSLVWQGRDAVTASKEAVALHRSLAEDDPKHTGNLANSLRWFSESLFEAGRRVEALEVARESHSLLRDLAKDQPQKFHNDLKASRENLSRCLKVLRLPVPEDLTY